MTVPLNDLVLRELGSPVRRSSALGGGCVGEVYRLDLEDGRIIVAKVDAGPAPRLDVEGYMLQYLREHGDLPVPELLWNTPSVLLMSFVPGNSQFSRPAELHAAQLLAALHGVRGPAFGLERDTLIGGLHQPNTRTASWVDFFREHRLLHMAREARREGVMPQALLARLEAFAGGLERFIDEPAYPSLLHGDVWTTNVLASGGRITGFIDPAVYYGDPEIELAFITLFSTFGQAFFDAYAARRPIRRGFFEQRRDIYNLYPLLVHARLFGASYLSNVDRTIGRLGY